MSNIDAMAADLFATISAYVDKRVTAAVEKMSAEMQTKLDSVADVAAHGRDGLLEEICGTDNNIERLSVAIAELKAMPPPKDGEAGRDGVDGKDGVSVDEVAVAQMVDVAVTKAAALIAVPKDGKSGADGKQGDPGINGKDADPVDYDAVVKKCLTLIPVPKDGENGIDGRDSIQCDVLGFVDIERRYQRGTYATHKGGLIRAFRATDPLGDGSLDKAGWAVVVDGIAGIEVKQGDDLRTFAIGAELTSGKAYGETFSLPVVIDRGKFERAKAYESGDATSWDGSLWIAQVDIENSGDKPLPPEWRLAVKRGQDGKDLRPEEAPRVREPLRLR